mmetsp:Transcript_6532/g.15983  ORF Transcript_6532/g.15983 Transcript_6532/m.15983 type:complete len:410 (+) Transcript_6532:47-1276(+)
MRTIRELGPLAASRRASHCLLVADDVSSCRFVSRAVDAVRDSLHASGVDVTVFQATETAASGRRPCPAAVGDAAQAAHACGANAIVGVGRGGTLDLSKASASMVAAGNQSALLERTAVGFSSSSNSVPQASVLPTFLVPTTATVASNSSRVLLKDEYAGGSFVPMNAPARSNPEWNPRPLGQAVVADITLASEQSVAAIAAAGAHSLSTCIDTAVATAGTAGTPLPRLWHVLWWDMAVGISSSAAALRDPQNNNQKAHRAALCAGSLASTMDENPRATVPMVHMLACAAAGAWSSISFPAVVAALLPPVIRACSTHSSAAEFRALAAVSETVVRKKGASPGDLASWVEEHCAGVEKPRLADWQDSRCAAAVLAMKAAESPLLRQPHAPAWLQEEAVLTHIFAEALARSE